MLAFLAACTPVNTPEATITSLPPASTPTLTVEASATFTATNTPTLEPGITPSLTATQTPDLRLKPEDWQTWQIIPTVSQKMIETYQQGLAKGNDPHVFSVIGDCQSSPTYFLSLYDEGRYELSADESHLQTVIDQFKGSFVHRSVTVKNGLTVSSVLNPFWADATLCEANETPLDCELRLSNPSIAIISLGTNWSPASTPEEYKTSLSLIVETLLTQGVVPILSTKADNAEGDYSRNLAMAEVAHAYDLPLWNFWRAVSELPNLGLDKDRENQYLNHQGWDVRNQTALEVLYAVWSALDAASN